MECQVWNDVEERGVQRGRGEVEFFRSVPWMEESDR